MGILTFTCKVMHKGSDLENKSWETKAAEMLEALNPAHWLMAQSQIVFSKM